MGYCLCSRELSDPPLWLSCPLAGAALATAPVCLLRKLLPGDDADRP